MRDDERARLDALGRLLLSEGELTPYGARLLRVVLDDMHDTPAPSSGGQDA